MVDAVVSFVVERLGELLIEQVLFLRGVRDEVTWLRNKLDMMSCFLKDAEDKQDGDHRVRKWISDVRDLAYDAEDIIDNFILKVEEGEGTPKKMGLKDCFQKYFCICSKRASLVEQANLYGIGKEINTLKKRLEEIQRNREIFNIRDINDGRQGSDRRNERLNELRREMPYEDNELVVGFQEDAAKLMSELVKEVKHRRVISIVGMGGLGKTTIARKLYNNDSLRQKFDCYAWVSVSKDYNIQDLLQKTIKSFKRPTSKEEFEFLEKMKELDDLETHLRKYLEGRRYLVVVDDVWDVNAWASLRRAFPDNKNGSRVIMTTRSKTVAEHCDERPYVYELPFLKEEESWELFYMHLRTLLFFNGENESDEFEIAQLQPLCMKLRLLRVLHLEELSFRRSRETRKVKLLDEIGKLIHLRYLGLRGTEIDQISPFIGNLHALQTLELDPFSDVLVQLPDEIRNAKQLRRLLGVFKWPFPVDNLTKLRTIGGVVVGDQMEFDPTVLINLRELWVKFVGRDRRITLDSIGGLRNLQFLLLDVDLEDSGSFPALQPLSQSQNLIQMKLWFKGAWKVPAEVHQFPPNLKYLSIDADLTEDPFPVLEKLPNLTLLELRTYGEANKLACSAGGFPQLEILVVIGISDEELEVEEGGMSMLKGLLMENFHLSNISGRLTSIPEAPEIYFDRPLY
ncbi:hypothetical protein RHGRI_022332 [Rhododendron griersonianum]|nr:hypothetical protein RHGRI_022332 [Rhododendron griersonianum]